MKFIIIVALLINLSATGSAENLCVKWQGHSVEANTTEALVQEIESSWSKDYFESAFDKAESDGTTSLTLEEFSSRFLPFLNFSFADYLKSQANNPDYEALATSIRALPVSVEALYEKYRSQFVYENFLYEWTIARLPESTSSNAVSIEGAKLYPLYPTARTGLDLSLAANSDLANSLTKKYIRQQTKLLRIRRCLFLLEIADEIEYCDDLTSNEIEQWAKTRFAAAIRGEPIMILNQLGELAEP